MDLRETAIAFAHHNQERFLSEIERFPPHPFRFHQP